MNDGKGWETIKVHSRVADGHDRLGGGIMEAGRELLVHDGNHSRRLSGWRQGRKDRAFYKAKVRRILKALQLDKEEELK